MMKLMNNYRVSIIIPVYNVEKYIVECLQSVANQTVADKIECIIVDDCGPDHSFAVAKEWVRLYEKNNHDKNALTPNLSPLTFKLIQREKNGGLSAARNTGVKEATGEYLYFLDSDDYLIPTAIGHLLTLADKHGGVDLLPALYITEGGKMSQFGAHSFPEFSDDRRLIKTALLDYDRMPVTAANRLVRREFFLTHNLWFKEGIIHEDNYWTFFLAKHVQRMAFTPERIYYYRSTEGSITKAPNREKETKAFTTFIRDFSANIDPYAKGAQKRLILYNLLTLLYNKYYKNEQECKEMIDIFATKNSSIERVLLKLYLNTKNNKILHLLERMYKLN